MADIKLFKVGQKVEELKSSAVGWRRNFRRFEKHFSCDVSKIGHCGTGNVQLRLRSTADFEMAKPFLRQAYDAN